VIVVFDSNVWISAIRFKGIPLLALDAAFLRHTIAICPEIESEVLRILTEKMLLSPQRTALQMRNYLESGLRLSIPGKLKGVCRDPKDDMVVECAAVAGASVIVSGDKDLLSLRSYRNIQICSPSEFLSKI
jgi:putative PIN family toxin of toxin-antitoxin system